MRSEVVHHHDLSCTEAWHERLRNVGLEDPGGARPFYGQRRPHPFDRHAGEQRRVLAPVSRYRKPKALAFWRIAVDRGQRSVQPALVYEEKPLGLHRPSHHHPPSGSFELVTLRCGSSPFFLVEPIRAIARHMVERLTESPVTVSM